MADGEDPKAAAQLSSERQSTSASLSVRILAAAALYFAAVFAVGLLCGIPRVLWLEPWLGKTVAVALEAPVLIVAMWVGAGVAAHMTDISGRAPLLAVGLIALALQQLADLSVGFGLRGMTLADQMAYFTTPPGYIYLLCLALFALMPLVRGGRRSRAPAER